MKPTPQVETDGLKAYEQARAFERLRAWRLPVTYAVFVLVPVVMGVAALKIGHIEIGELQFGAAVLFAMIAWFQWRRLQRRYVRNFELVRELERTYGDQLPWVQVNNHFAALEKLQHELAEEKAERRSA